MQDTLDAPPLLSNLVEQAIELAAQWHDGTYRKSTWRPPAFDVPADESIRTPVMVHLTAAAFSVQQAGWGPVAIAATFLHDILEDSNRYDEHFTEAQLRQSMGDEVTALVLQLTEKKVDDNGQPRSWKDRKNDYIASIPSFDPQAVAICLADKHHNMWSINHSLQNGVDIFSSAKNRKRLSSGPESQLWFYSSVLEASRGFQDKRLDGLRSQLDSAVQLFRTLTSQRSKDSSSQNE